MSVQSKMTAIANAIRAKTGGSASLGLDEMATEIAGLSKPAGAISITSNGTHDVTNYASAAVNVQPANFRQWTITLASAVTASTVILTDSWLAANFSNASLTVVVQYGSFSGTFSSKAATAAMGSNRPLLKTSGGGTIYGILAYSGLSEYTHGWNLEAVNSSGISLAGCIYLKSSGQLKLYGGNWPAGVLHITAFYDP